MISLFVFISSVAWGSCFPETAMRIPSYVESIGVTWDQYEKLIKKIESEYAPDFKAVGRELEIPSAWRTAEVQAHAVSQGKKDQVTVNGGMARHPLMTPDALTIVFCHELGHHIGGAPQALFFNGKSVEGQADYFATLKCLRRLFAHDDNRRFLADNNVEPEIRNECKISFTSDQDVAICLRSAVASKVMGNVTADVRRERIPTFLTPDQTRVEYLYGGHTKSQCRLDTYLAGAFCPVQASLELSPFDLDVGTCSRWYGQKRGVRPLCWYDEKLNFSYPNDLKSVLEAE